MKKFISVLLSSALIIQIHSSSMLCSVQALSTPSVSSNEILKEEFKNTFKTYYHHSIKYPNILHNSRKGSISWGTTISLIIGICLATVLVFLLGDKESKYTSNKITDQKIIAGGIKSSSVKKGSPDLSYAISFIEDNLSVPASADPNAMLAVFQYLQDFLDAYYYVNGKFKTPGSREHQIQQIPSISIPYSVKQYLLSITKPELISSVLRVNLVDIANTNRYDELRILAIDLLLKNNGLPALPPIFTQNRGRIEVEKHILTAMSSIENPDQQTVAGMIVKTASDIDDDSSSLLVKQDVINELVSLLETRVTDPQALKSIEAYITVGALHDIRSSVQEFSIKSLPLVFRDSDKAGELLKEILRQDNNYQMVKTNFTKKITAAQVLLSIPSETAKEDTFIEILRLLVTINHKVIDKETTASLKTLINDVRKKANPVALKDAGIRLEALKAMIITSGTAAELEELFNELLLLCKPPSAEEVSSFIHADPKTIQHEIQPKILYVLASL